MIQILRAFTVLAEEWIWFPATILGDCNYLQEIRHALHASSDTGLTYAHTHIHKHK